eukprot:562879-Pyramimonas_sp.AAC.1
MVENGFQNPRPPAPSGLLRPIAAKVLMEIVDGARMARYDLLWAACTFAPRATKWTEQQYMEVFRLARCIKAALRYRMVSWAGGKPA